MSIDEAILKARIENSVPNTVRLYRWKPSAVSIGKFQKIEKEVHLENCKKYGVDIVRRITGGGTVYHDADGEITYSVVVNKKDFRTEDIAAIYARIYAGLVNALKVLGVIADFNVGNERTCPNLTARGKKISGSAQAHKRGTVLQHGTLLVDVDLLRMFTYIGVPWAKTCMEIANIAEGRITSLKRELGRVSSAEEVSIALTEGFQKAFKIQLAEGELTGFELDLAEKIREEKYATDEWNYKGKSVQSE